MLDINNWRDNLFPLVTKWFDDRLAKRKNVISQVISVETQSMYQEQEQGLGGYGRMGKYDGNEIREMSQYKGFKTTYITEEFAGKMSIQYKFAKLDLSKEAKKVGTRIADAMTMTQLMDFYELFSNGFNDDYTGADGKALFATDHPVHAESDSSDTFSNLGTSEFSVSAITATKALMRRFKTYDGLPFLCDPDIVLVSPELEHLCIQYFGDNAKLLPGTDYNDNNPVYDMKYVVIDTFTAKQWALGDSLLMKDHIKMKQTTAPMVIEQKTSNPLIAEYIGYMDYTLGWSEPKVIFGHNPA